MSRAHVRRRKGFCGGRRDEAVRGNAVSADTQVSRASLCLLLLCACLQLPCLITLHVRDSCYCQGLDVAALLACMKSGFWHTALETALCCFDVLLKAFVQRRVSRDQERGHVCSLWLKIIQNLHFMGGNVHLFNSMFLCQIVCTSQHAWAGSCQI